MTATREVLVCLNRSSGGASADRFDPGRIESLLTAAGLAPRIRLVDGPGIAAQAAQAVRARADLLVVGGGDGSVGAAAGELAGTGTALAILPLGTRNHFARDLRIPLDLAEAARLVAGGRRRRVDIAEVNGRVFVNNSAIGLYPLMVIDRDRQRERLGRGKRLAMLVASLRTLARFGHYRLALTVNDRRAMIDTPLLFVGNNDYRFDLATPGRRESVEDGRLSVFVMRSKTRRGFIAAIARALAGRARADDMVRLDGVERLLVASRRHRLAVSVDGEVVRERPPLDYRVRKRALAVIAP